MIKCLHFYFQGDNCPKPKSQAQDTFRPTSCLDYLSRGASNCGMYKLYDNAGNSYPAYCDMKSEPGTAWTLVMSSSTKHRALPSFRSVPLNGNAPVNENAQNWNLYRLSLTRVRSLQAHSTHWRATCSYPTYGVDFKDYVRGNFKDFNVVDFSGSGKCMKVEYVNIRGHMRMHLTARVWAGRLLLTYGTSTAVVPVASLTQDLVQCHTKTTLVITLPWTQSSAATSRPIPQLSGGLELICKPFLRSKRSRQLSTEAVILQLWFRT